MKIQARRKPSVVTQGHAKNNYKRVQSIIKPPRDDVQSYPKYFIRRGKITIPHFAIDNCLLFQARRKPSVVTQGHAKSNYKRVQSILIPPRDD
jgi:hypothetical protein